MFGDMKRDTFKKASNITARIAARLARGEEISVEALARREDDKRKTAVPTGENVDTAAKRPAHGELPVGEIYRFAAKPSRVGAGSIGVPQDPAPSSIRVRAASNLLRQSALLA